MIPDTLARNFYESLNNEQKIKIALYSDFGDEAKELYNWLQDNQQKQSPQLATPLPQPIDGVYYIYTDGTTELFDHSVQNKPTKPVKRIGIVMGSHSLAVNLNDLPEQPLTNSKDTIEYGGYIKEYDDAVADWNGMENTKRIKQIGTNIELNEGEWIPSVAELYLIYLNKRSVNTAIELSGGSRIKNGWYWSSTEGSATYAWRLYLIDGSLDWLDKVQLSLYVRAVAAFH